MSSNGDSDNNNQAGAGNKPDLLGDIDEVSRGNGDPLSVQEENQKNRQVDPAKEDR